MSKSSIYIYIEYCAKVSSHLHLENTLDLAYSNIKEVFKVSPAPTSAPQTISNVNSCTYKTLLITGKSTLTESLACRSHGGVTDVTYQGKKVLCSNWFKFQIFSSNHYQYVWRRSVSVWRLGWTCSRDVWGMLKNISKNYRLLSGNKDLQLTISIRGPNKFDLNSFGFCKIILCLYVQN